MAPSDLFLARRHWVGLCVSVLGTTAVSRNTAPHAHPWRRDLCKNGWTDRHAVWGADSLECKERCIRCGI